LRDRKKIYAKTENGDSAVLKLLGFSTEDEYDLAILKMEEELREKGEILLPKISSLSRGIPVCFSGFPHGINDLLVQTAYVSGPFKDIGFYIDGSVNGGNSGGPVVDMRDGKVIGIITQRRFLTPIDLEQVYKDLHYLHEHFRRMEGRAGVVISGIDFGQFAQLMSTSFSVFGKVLNANANTGIGIAYRINFLTNKIETVKA